MPSAARAPEARRPPCAGLRKPPRNRSHAEPRRQRLQPSNAEPGRNAKTQNRITQENGTHPAGFVALDGGHGPVVGGVPEPSVRGESALDQDGSSRPFGDGREAEVASQGLQFGFPNAVEGFGEDDGQDGGSDAGNGAQDIDGLPAFHGPDPVDGLIDFGPGSP